MSEHVVADPRPLAAVLVSAVAVVLIVASHRRPNVRESWSVLAAVAKFLIVASMLPGVLDGTEYRWSMGEFVFGVELALRADALGMLFALLASFLWIFTAFYTAGYMRGLGEHGQTRFFAAFAASLSTAIGIAFAENLLVIFVFYELLSLVTYPLVAHDETAEARTAGRKYLAYTFFGGGFLVLGGTAMVYWLTGLADPADVSGVATGESTATVTFGEMAEPLAAVTGEGLVGDPVLQLSFTMLALGFGTKAAIMPFHSWLPDAMVAPTPVSGLLHAVAVVKSGAFGVSRVVLHVFEPELTADLGMHLPLAALAAFTFVAASFIALRKDNLKRRLAYSTISQLSYIVMGVALLVPTGVTGGLLHIPAHAFMKLTLFFCAGAIHVETHTDDISDMAGIAKRMPLTMSAFAVAAAGMAGIPLIAGFVSKFYMLIGGVQMADGAYAIGEPTAAGFVFAAALVVSGVLNIAYFWPIVYAAFFESEDRHDAKPLVEFSHGGRTSSYGVLGDDGGAAADDEHVVPDGGESGAGDDDADAGTGDVDADDVADADPGDDVDSDDPDRHEGEDFVAGRDTTDDHATGREYGEDREDAADEATRPDHDEWVSEEHGYAADHTPSDTDVPHGDRSPVAGPDVADEDVDHGGHADHGTPHSSHHGGPPPGGWDRRTPWTESTWLMLGPIMVICLGAVVLGIVPAEVGFLELARDVAGAVTGGGVVP